MNQGERKVRKEREGIEKEGKEKKKGVRGIKRGRRPSSLKSTTIFPIYLTVIVGDEDADLVWTWDNSGVGGAKHQ